MMLLSVRLRSVWGGCFRFCPRYHHFVALPGARGPGDATWLPGPPCWVVCACLFIHTAAALLSPCSLTHGRAILGSGKHGLCQALLPSHDGNVRSWMEAISNPPRRGSPPEVNTRSG